MPYQTACLGQSELDPNYGQVIHIIATAIDRQFSGLTHQLYQDLTSTQQAKSFTT